MFLFSFLASTKLTRSVINRVSYNPAIRLLASFRMFAKFNSGNSLSDWVYTLHSFFHFFSIFWYSSNSPTIFQSKRIQSKKWRKKISKSNGNQKNMLLSLPTIFLFLILLLCFFFVLVFPSSKNVKFFFFIFQINTD